MGAGGGEDAVGEGALEPACRAVAEDAGLRVGVDAQDLLAHGGVPVAAGEFDFGEFGHGLRGCRRLLVNCYRRAWLGGLSRQPVTNNRSLLRPLEELGGLRVAGVEGLGAAEEGDRGPPVLVLVEPEAGEFAEGAGLRDRAGRRGSP